MEMNISFWGVVVKPGDTVKCDPPGEFYYHISQIAIEPGELNENVHIVVKVDGKRTLLGTLSVENCPQIATDLVFEKEFELQHTSKICNIFFCGYQAEAAKRSDFSTKQVYDSDEEVPLAIPLYPSSDDNQGKEAQHSPSKLTARKPSASASPKPNTIMEVLEETKNPRKSKAAADDDSNKEDDDGPGEGESGGDEDMIYQRDSSDDNGESSDKEETPPKNTKGKIRLVETPLKTPSQKKAKLTTPIMDSKAGGTRKRSGYVHVATPHPAKQAKKTPNNMSNNSTGYAYKLCNK